MAACTACSDGTSVEATTHRTHGGSMVTVTFKTVNGDVFKLNFDTSTKARNCISMLPVLHLL